MGRPADPDRALRAGRAACHIKRADYANVGHASRSHRVITPRLEHARRTRHQVSLDIAPGRFFTIVGPSGHDALGRPLSPRPPSAHLRHCARSGRRRGPPPGRASGPRVHGPALTTCRSMGTCAGSGALATASSRRRDVLVSLQGLPYRDARECRQGGARQSAALRQHRGTRTSRSSMTLGRS